MRRAFFDRLEEVGERLSELSPRQQFAFAAACCERQVPIYRTFCERSAWGSLSLLRKSLDAVWDHLIHDGPFRVAAGSLDASGVHPGDDAPDEVQVEDSLGLALNTSSAVSTLVDAVAEGNTTYLRSVAESALNTVDAFLFDTVPGLDVNDRGRSIDLVDAHALMLQEVARQRADLSLLSSSSVETAAHALRERWREKSILERSDQPPASAPNRPQTPPIL